MSYIGKTPTSVPLTSSDITDGIITTTKIADANVTNPKLTSGSQQNFRNIIINGDMSIAQRNTSRTGITSGGYYTLDRFDSAIDSVGTWTQSQDTDVPSGQGFSKSLKMDCTTARANLSASSLAILRTKIEGQNVQYLKKGTSSAESLTASFWVKSNKTGTYIAIIYDNDNSRQISKSYTISSANTWEKKTLTFAGDTSGAFDNDNNKSLYLDLYLVAGSNFTSGTLQTSWAAYVAANSAAGQVNLADSTDNNIWITGVQLEAGTTASDFEFLPVDVNLKRCQRYCYAYANYGDGNVAGNRSYSSQYSNGSIVYVFYPTTLRATPTLSYGNGSGTANVDLSNISEAQLYDSDDAGFFVFELLAEAEL